MEKTLSLNIDSFPKELKLILKLIHKEDYKHDLIENNMDFTDIDWNLFLKLIMHHRLYPLLLGKVKRIDNKIMPLFVKQTIREAFQKNTFEMLHLSNEMGRIGRLFNDHQVHMLVLKGPVLAKDLYGDISHRTCGDLDILVPINKLEVVDHLLFKEGYLKDNFIDKTLDDWKWRNHHIKYFHPEKRINIEIHWRLNPFPGSGPNFQKLWLRKRRSTVTSFPIYYLGKEDLFLFLASHGSRHGWFRLRWLVDIHQMLVKDMDWHYLKSQLKKYQYLPAAGQAIFLSNALLNTPLNNEIKSLIKGNLTQKLAQEAVFFLDKMVDLHSETVPEPVIQYHKKHLYHLMTKKQKTLYVMSFFYPYPLDAETLPLPKYLYVLYFPLRPFLWAWRKTKKHALS